MLLSVPPSIAVPETAGAPTDTGGASTTAVEALVAGTAPASLEASTTARMNLPASASASSYVEPVPTAEHPTPGASQRSHEYEYVIVAVPSHVPSLTDSVSPERVVPVTAGSTEFDGSAGTTTRVSSEVASSLPAALSAVTVTRIVWPTSSPVSA